MNRATVLVMLAVCASLLLAACRDEPATVVPTSTTASAASGPAALAASFAPLVHLADTEHNPPMDTDMYLANSSLVWVHDDSCGDKTVAEHPVARDLGQGTYHARMTSRRVTGCRATGPTYTSVQQTRPYDNPDLGAEGFVLTPHNESLYRKGNAKAPVNVQYVPGDDAHKGLKGYVYWFFYPYNDFPAAVGLGDHEGDWERVSVVTDADDRPQRVVYSQHENRCSVNWRDAVGPDGRPQVYVAAGAHGSYPKPGDYDNPEKIVPIDDHTSDDGAKWETWSSIRDVEAQEWWHYQGGWGKKGHDISVPGTGAIPADFMTGPVGPNPSKNMQAEVFATDGSCPKPKTATTTTTPTSTTAGKTPRTTAGAIQRMEKFLHALGSGDIATLCEIAGPAAKQAEDEGFGPCETTMAQMHGMVSAAQLAALRDATVDPAKVTGDGARVEIPASAVRAATPFTSSDLGDYTLEYRSDDWYIVD
jgi:hypothetical protein